MKIMITLSTNRDIVKSQQSFQTQDLFLGPLQLHHAGKGDDIHVDTGMLQRPGLPDLFIAGTDHIAQAFQDAVHLRGIGDGGLPLFTDLEGRIRRGDGRQLERQHVLRMVRPFLRAQAQ